MIGSAGGQKSGAGGTTREQQFETAVTQTVSGDKIPSSSSQKYVASTTSEIPQQQQREQRQLVNRVLDETRDNIRRSIMCYPIHLR
ncbi:MAG: hypothetical protein WCC17_01695 [Candidatus Nitrosopolaris sp.]